MKQLEKTYQAKSKNPLNLSLGELDSILTVLGIDKVSWLGRLDSNQRMTVSKTVALPLGDAPINIEIKFL